MLPEIIENLRISRKPNKTIDICIQYMYVDLVMIVTWDPNKAKINFRKHKIRFSDAEMALYDPFAMTLEEHVVATEQRFVTVGYDAVGRIIAVVYSYRADTIRLISARKTTPEERKQYEKGI